MGELRKHGIRATIYLDDMLIAAATRHEATRAVTTALRLLDDLGFTVNLPKSVTTPTQRIKHLGFIWDTKKFVLQLPSSKRIALRKEARRVIRESSQNRLTIRRLAGLVGKITAAAPAARVLDFRRHAMQRTIQFGLRRSRQDWDATVQLSRTALRDARWLATGALRFARPTPMQIPSPDVTITTDASPSGHGGVFRQGELEIEKIGRAHV